MNLSILPLLLLLLVTLASTAIGSNDDRKTPSEGDDQALGGTGFGASFPGPASDVFPAQSGLGSLVRSEKNAHTNGAKQHKLDSVSNCLLRSFDHWPSACLPTAIRSGTNSLPFYRPTSTTLNGIPSGGMSSNLASFPSSITTEPATPVNPSTSPAISGAAEDSFILDDGVAEPHPYPEDRIQDLQAFFLQDREKHRVDHLRAIPISPSGRARSSGFLSLIEAIFRFSDFFGYPRADGMSDNDSGMELEMLEWKPPQQDPEGSENSTNVPDPPVTPPHGVPTPAEWPQVIHPIHIGGVRPRYKAYPASSSHSSHTHTPKSTLYTSLTSPLHYPTLSHHSDFSLDQARSQAAGPGENHQLRTSTSTNNTSRRNGILRIRFPASLSRGIRKLAI
ncbi:hypothetical protein DL93DRAFT_2172730 [Clavulina sp. PMI_390]|nr:hypothetical protein DL93DRAFT_2172730 [Clavulina sp. PMI_390]